MISLFEVLDILFFLEKSQQSFRIASQFVFDPGG
jgi:hypothetical protein